ncbi:MAG: hypothetical protein ACKOS8_15325 [Gemmataceae bacterium]
MGAFVMQFFLKGIDDALGQGKLFVLILSPMVCQAPQDQSFKILGKDRMGFTRVDFPDQWRQTGNG